MVMPNPRPNPYVGPRPFKAGETLYGRDHEIRELLDHFISERIVLLYSPSGAGKTSLLSAGLIPRLVETGFQVLPIVRVSIETDSGSTKTANPVERDTKAVPGNRYVLSTLLSLEEGLPSDRQLALDELAPLTIADYLAERAARDSSTLGKEDNGQVLIFDQFEEILTLNPTDREGKVEFFSQLGAALRNKDRWALIAMREDYIGGLDPYVRPIPTRLNNRFRLDLLGAQAAKQAMQQPAQKSGVAFTDEAAIRLVDDLRRVQVQQPDGTMVEQLGLYVEPVQLQVVCYRLWQLLNEEANVIHEPDLDCIGDVNESLSQYYAERVKLIADKAGMRERLIRDWFQDKLITEHGIRSQVLKGIKQSDGLENKAVTALENAYLIRAEKRRGITWFELVHDRMIDPVRTNNAAWYAENLSLLQRQAALWIKESQPEHLLLREQALDEVEAWAKEHEEELLDSEREFLSACLEVRQRENELQMQKEQEIKLQEQARSANRLRTLLIVAVIAAIAAVGFATFAMFARADAVKNERLANSESTRAVAQQVTAEFNAGVANVESTRAVAQQATAEYNASVANAASTEAVAQQATAEYNANLAQENEAEARRQEEEAKRLAALANSRQLAAQSAGYANNNPSLASLLAIEAYYYSPTWESRNQLLLPLQRASDQAIYPYNYQIPPQPKDLYSVSISPDGKYLAFGSSDGKVTIWDYISRTEVLTRQAHNENRVFSVDFSPDGRYLTSAAAGTILLWDIQNLDNDPVIMDVHQAPVYSVAFDPSGEYLATGVGKKFFAYKIGETEPIGQTADSVADIVGVAWSPAGERVAGIAKDGSLVVWETKNPNVERVIKGHAEPGLSIAWSPEGLLATGGQDGEIIFWNTVSWRPDGDSFEAHELGWVQSLAFSADGRYLASGSDDQTVKVWDVSRRSQLGEALDEHDDIVRSVDFSPTRGETLLASAGFDNVVYLHEISTLQSLGTETGQVSGSIVGVGNSPSGNLRLAVESGNQVTIREGLGEEAQTIGQYPKGNGTAALSQDGSLLAIGQEDSSVILYAVDTAEELPTLSGIEGDVTGLAFNPGGSQVAVLTCGKAIRLENGVPDCEYTEIWLFETNSGASVGSILLDSPGFRRAVALQDDQPSVAVGGQDGGVLVYDSINQSWTAMATQLPAGISSLAFSRDGTMLASGNADKSLQLWDVHAAQPIAQAMFGAPDIITSLVFEPETGYLLSGSKNGALLSWVTSPAEWIPLNCELADRSLTYSEWEQFFPGLDFMETCPGY